LAASKLTPGLPASWAMIRVGRFVNAIVRPSALAFHSMLVPRRLPAPGWLSTRTSLAPSCLAITGASMRAYWVIAPAGVFGTMSWMVLPSK
jgi:hypothetical protein